MAELAIIDYGAGNVRSVDFALKRLGVKAVVSSNIDVIATAKRVIFPGVGHAEFAMKALKTNGIADVLPSLKVPVLGICLGMQLMCEGTAEGDIAGLKIFDTNVKKFSASEKIPHMGWNSVEIKPSPLFADFSGKPYFYFVHSYFAESCLSTTSVCDYVVPFSASLEKDNFFGCQFHPEKSSLEGEKVLRNFLKL